MKSKTHFLAGWATLLLTLGLLTSCDHVLHNGTSMAISQVKLIGLPSSPYAAGTSMVFSYNTGNGWIHDQDSTFTDAKYSAKVLADGSWTLNFSPALLLTASQLQYLLIDAGKNWNTMKITKKISGQSGVGDDGLMDNLWSGASAPTSLVGTVRGSDVTWVWQ